MSGASRNSTSSFRSMLFALQWVRSLLEESRHAGQRLLERLHAHVIQGNRHVSSPLHQGQPAPGTSTFTVSIFPPRFSTHSAGWMRRGGADEQGAPVGPAERARVGERRAAHRAPTRARPRARAGTRRWSARRPTPAPSASSAMPSGTAPPSSAANTRRFESDPSRAMSNAVRPRARTTRRRSRCARPGVMTDAVGEHDLGRGDVRLPVGIQRAPGDVVRCGVARDQVVAEVPDVRAAVSVHDHVVAVEVGDLRRARRGPRARPDRAA